MKRKSLMFLFILIVLVTGCSKRINLENSTNFGMISTIKNDSIINGSTQYDKTYIFEDYESYKEYYHKFFVVNGEITGLEASDFENNSIILYNTLIDKERGGKVFHIEEVRISGKKIKIYITSSGQVKTDEEVYDEYYNYSYIVKINKSLIPENHEVIVVNK